jgi:DNA-binding protein HU-beta
MARATTKIAARKVPAKTGTKGPATRATKTTAAASRQVSAAKAPAKGTTKPVRAAATKAATAKAVVLTLRHIADQLAGEHELPKRQANEMLTQMIEIITRRLKKGDKIRLTGLGILQVKKRAARMGRNPATGEAIKIKASKKIAFRAAKELKEAI